MLIYPMEWPTYHFRSCLIRSSCRKDKGSLLCGAGVSQCAERSGGREMAGWENGKERGEGEMEVGEGAKE